MTELVLEYEKRSSRADWYRKVRREECKIGTSVIRRSSGAEARYVYCSHHRLSSSHSGICFVRKPASRNPVRKYAVEQQFRSLASEWEDQTRYESTAIQKFLAPSYQRIIGLGPSVVPYILRDLQLKPNHWFWALVAITGENPVMPDDAGNIRRMTAAWLDWGRKHGLL